MARSGSIFIDFWSIFVPKSCLKRLCRQALREQRFEADFPKFLDRFCTPTMRSRFCATARIICVFPYKTRGPHDQHSRFQRELRTKFALESHTVFGSKFDRKSCENCVERGSRTRLTEKTLPKAVWGSFWSPRRAVGASRATFSTPRGGLGRPPGAPGGPPGAPGGSPGAPGGFLGPSWGALWRSWGAPGAPEASRGAPGVDFW